MKRLTWKDANGGSHYLHKVRAHGNGSYLVLDILRNSIVVEDAGRTRAEAWQMLRAYEETVVGQEWFAEKDRPTVDYPREDSFKERT